MKIPPGGSACLFALQLHNTITRMPESPAEKLYLRFLEEIFRTAYFKVTPPGLPLT